MVLLMNESRIEIGSRLFIAALFLGLLGDVLLRAMPWGLNIVLWTLMLLSGVAVLAGPRTTILQPDKLALAATLFLFACGIAWRDSPVLRGLDALGFCVSAALLAWLNRGGNLGDAGLSKCAGGLATAAGLTAIGFPQLLARDVKWTGLSRHTVFRHTPAVLAGLALSLPLVILFGGLFVAADGAYRRLVGEFFHFHLEEWMPHIVMFGGTMWAAGGYLRTVALREEIPPCSPGNGVSRDSALSSSARCWRC